MLIRDVMTTPCVTCERRETLHSAASRMFLHERGALIVTDERGRLAGLLTERDIVRATFSQGYALHAMRVEDSMSRTVVTCAPTDTVEEVVARMKELQIRRVPVIDDARYPVGMVSFDDLARTPQEKRIRGRAPLSPPAWGYSEQPASREAFSMEDVMKGAIL